MEPTRTDGAEPTPARVPPVPDALVSYAEAPPERRARIEQVYGASTAGAIDTALRVIRMGNLMGNTLDYWLWRLSGGRWGTPVGHDGSMQVQHPTLGGGL